VGKLPKGGLADGWLELQGCLIWICAGFSPQLSWLELLSSRTETLSLQTLLCLSSSEALAEDWLFCHSQLPCEQKANVMPKKTNIQPMKNIPVVLAVKWLL